MSSNPFLVGADLTPAQQAEILAPGQRVRVRYHTHGSGLGGERQEFDLIGDFIEHVGVSLRVRETSGVVSYPPIVWIDDLEILDA